MLRYNKVFHPYWMKIALLQDELKFRCLIYDLISWYIGQARHWSGGGLTDRASGKSTLNGGQIDAGWYLDGNRYTLCRVDAIYADIFGRIYVFYNVFCPVKSGTFQWGAKTVRKHCDF